MLLRYHGHDLALVEVLEAERLGYDSVWSGEAYGTDAVTPTAWILARTTRIRPAPASCRCRRARPPARP
jgi:alkanesulfonate monooxygenase SsuD/methylene tetrahydromethanopterin reductase-like flavin-dependent oxidoreductase (luciferase family)